MQKLSKMLGLAVVAIVCSACYNKATTQKSKESLQSLCESHDKPACFELKKIELSELNEPKPYQLWDFMDDFWDMCHRFSYIVPQSCDERDKTAQRYIRAVLALPKDEKGSYYIQKLDLLSHQTGSLNPKILQMASSARDEIIAEFEKDCNANDTQSCAMLTSFYYGLLLSWDIDYIEILRSYDGEVHKIYAPKFQAVAQKACELGDARSCMNGAAFYYFYKPKQDYAVARDFGKKLYYCLKMPKFKANLT
ncbi:hypothetical protein [uncultured Helicobacter sp.]|uniref:hypothetical protein n=1 Tax=uncultured Helicobacter sp. TaxID=175537 RepID=UPI0027DE99B7|nr:hypothetical protein [uncultured Helicobacter sp.]